MRARPAPSQDPSLSRMLKWKMKADDIPSARENLEGPRSLPARGTPHADLQEASYSSIALAATDDPRVAATLSLPDRSPPSRDARRLPPPAARRHHSLHQSHRNEHLRQPRSYRIDDECPPLARSDSLLNRARRVFSLPASLKRRGPRPFATSLDSVAALERERHGGAFSYRRRTRNVDTDSSFTNTIRSKRKTTSFVDRHHSELEDVEPRDMKEAEAKIRVLESQLEAERIRSSRLRKKIERLEEEGALYRQAMPSVETIIKSALAQFQAKEMALKHTISKINQEYTALLVEKNEAMRLLNAFVGRGGRSPPPSFSSVSESGTEGFNRDSRRVLSIDPSRRARAAAVLSESAGSSIASNTSSLPTKKI